MKRCTKCGTDKPQSEYYAAKGTRDGLRGDCKACFKARAKARYPIVRDAAIERARQWRVDNIDRYRENQRRMRSNPEFKQRAREYHLGRKHGITQAQYEAMLAEQGGGCAICERPPREDISLHVDHDHATGANRGLLCFRCNNALGDFDDDVNLLTAAASYLIGHEPESQRLAVIARQRAAALRGGSPN